MLEIGGKELKRVLNVFGGLGLQKSCIPILHNLKLTAERGNKLILEGTNLDAWVWVEVPCRGGLPQGKILEGPVLANFAELKKVATQAGKETLLLFRPPEGNGLKVRGDGWEVAVSGDVLDEFPVTPVLPASSWFYEGENLGWCIASACRACAEGDGRYSLAIPVLDQKDGEVSLVATNGHWLYRRRLGEAGTTEEKKIILGSDFSSLLRVVQEKGTCSVDVQGEYVVIEVQDEDGFSAGVFGRMPEYVYPDYRQIIPAGSPRNVLVVPLKDFSAAAGRVTPSSRDDDELSVDLRIINGTLTIQTPNQGKFANVATIPTSDSGSWEVRVNGGYLQDILACFRKGTETVKVEYWDYLKPLVISSPDDLGMLAVLMPREKK